MARVHSPIRFSGSIGNLTYFQKNGKQFVKEKSGVDAARIATDQRFKRTREIMAEFGKAGKACKLIRSALSDHFMHPPNARVAGKLTAEVFRVIRSDKLNAAGDRTVMDGDIRLLEGFSFYRFSAGMDGITCQPTIDRSQGRVLTKVTVTGNSCPHLPVSATHKRITAIAIELNFPDNAFIVNSHACDPIPVDNSRAFELFNTFIPNSRFQLLLVIRTELLSISDSGNVLNIGGMEFNNMVIVAGSNPD